MTDNRCSPGSAKLLPCPFCGAQPRSSWQGADGPNDDCGYWDISCCGAFAHEDDEESAVRIWNTRPDVAAKPLGPCTQAELDAFEGLDSKSKQLFLMWVDRAQKAEAALDAAQATWQPIDSAPKMKNILLFAVTDIGDDGAVRNWKMDTGYWSAGAECWTWSGYQVRKYDIHPTHWMPIPEGPALPSTNRGAPDA